MKNIISILILLTILLTVTASVSSSRSMSSSDSNNGGDGGGDSEYSGSFGFGPGGDFWKSILGGGGYGGGYGGPSGGHSRNGVTRPTVVCKDRGPCYQKKVTCPAKCFYTFSYSGKGYGGGGGGGGCTIDCKKKCMAYC